MICYTPIKETTTTTTYSQRPYFHEQKCPSDERLPIAIIHLQLLLVLLVLVVPKVRDLHILVDMKVINLRRFDTVRPNFQTPMLHTFWLFLFSRCNAVSVFQA